MTSRKYSQRGLIPRPWLWVDPFLESNDTVQCHFNGDTHLGIPIGVPRPLGSPIFLGTTEGPVRENPGVKRQKTTVNLLPGVSESSYTYDDATVEAVLLWSGDLSVVSLFEEKGPRGLISYGGGDPDPVYHKLLVIYTDDLRPISGYQHDKPKRIVYRLFWKVSFDSVVRESEGLPRKFNMTAHVFLECSKGVGKMSWVRWQTDQEGNLVHFDGSRP